MTSRGDASESTRALLTRAASLLTWVARAIVSRDAAGQPPIAGMADDDWSNFLKLASTHATLPLAWHALEPFAGSLPEVLAADLRAAWEANARRNLTLAGELRGILAGLDNAGVKGLPWKGPVLAQRAYGDLSLRQFFDLDVLIHRADMNLALATLLGLGFQPEKHMTDKQRETYVDHQGELELVRPSDGLWLELHTAVVPTYYAAGRSSDDLWRHAVSAQLAREEVLTLDPVDDIEALCVHGSKHRWDRLIWIVDVALMAQQLDGKQWQRLLTGAQVHGTLRMVAIGMSLAADMCGATLPADAARDMRSDRTAVALSLAAQRALFDPKPSRFDALLFHARMRERFRDRARYLLSVVFTPSGADWGAVRLPRLLFPLYAITRPVRLAAKYGRRLVSPPR